MAANIKDGSSFFCLQGKGLRYSRDDRERSLLYRLPVFVCVQPHSWSSRPESSVRRRLGPQEECCSFCQWSEHKLEHTKGSGEQARTRGGTPPTPLLTSVSPESVACRVYRLHCSPDRDGIFIVHYSSAGGFWKYAYVGSLRTLRSLDNLKLN
jgi:hypothetical protein